MAKEITRTAVGGALSGAVVAQVRKAPAKRLNKTKTDRFLVELAQSCNVTVSCRKAKVSSTAIYAHRRKSPPFAAAWQQAIADGYARLELMLLQNAIAAYAPPEPGDAGDDTEQNRLSEGATLRLLTLHRQQVGAIRAAEARSRAETGIPAPEAGALERLQAKLTEMHERLTADVG